MDRPRCARGTPGVTGRRRIHIALGVADVGASVADYSRRLGCAPSVQVPGTYALWRSEEVNFSIRHAPDQAGRLRHLGWEDPEAELFTRDTDLNGVTWELFTAKQQENEIEAAWPGWLSRSDLGRR
jgi:hypothetical protein